MINFKPLIICLSVPKLIMINVKLLNKYIIEDTGNIFITKIKDYKPIKKLRWQYESVINQLLLYCQTYTSTSTFFLIAFRLNCMIGLLCSLAVRFCSLL